MGNQIYNNNWLSNTLLVDVVHVFAGFAILLERLMEGITIGLMVGAISNRNIMVSFSEHK